MNTLSIMIGVGKKSSWMFLCEGDRGKIIKGFSKGGLQAVKKYLAKEYQNFTLGEILGAGYNRRRLIYVTPFTRVNIAPREKSADELAAERGLANAQMAHTQLKAWEWRGLK